MMQTAGAVTSHHGLFLSMPNGLQVSAKRGVPASTSQVERCPLLCCSSTKDQTFGRPKRRVSAVDKDGGQRSTQMRNADMDREYENEVFTKFIDEQLMLILHYPDGVSERLADAPPVRQIVLLTDGTDSRPYLLPWPSPSLIYAISPGHVFCATSRKHLDMGMKVPRSCLLQHISVDLGHYDWGTEDLEKKLMRKGYSGELPSVWAVQMPATLSDEFLQGMLRVAASLLMKSSTFIGVLSMSSGGVSEEDAQIVLRRLFASNGFKLELYTCEELAKKLNLEQRSTGGCPSPMAFIAQQQRLSDAQVERGNSLMEQAEAVDEDGFEDSW